MEAVSRSLGSHSRIIAREIRRRFESRLLNRFADHFISRLIDGGSNRGGAVVKGDVRFGDTGQFGQLDFQPGGTCGERHTLNVIDAGRLLHDHAR